MGDVYGGFTCNSGDDCNIKTTEMSPNGGFYGKYGAPSLVENTVAKLRMRFLEAGYHGHDDYIQL